MSPLLNRREAIAALAATATVPLMNACSDQPPSTPPPAAAAAGGAAAAKALLDEIGEHYVRAFPENATSLGVDTGARAGLRSLLTDRSADGQKRIADTVRQDLEKAKAFDVSGLDHATRTSIEVSRRAGSMRVSTDGACSQRLL